MGGYDFVVVGGRRNSNKVGSGLGGLVSRWVATPQKKILTLVGGFDLGFCGARRKNILWVAEEGPHLTKILI